MRLPGWWAAAISTGMVAAALRWSTPPALIPPMSGSTRRSTTGRPSRPPTIAPTDRSPASGPGPRWGTTRSRATRSDSAGDRIPDRASGHQRVGTPRFSPSGMGRSRPRAQMDAPVVPGATSWSPRPSSSHNPVASGRRARKASAARSTVRPANGVDRSLPPVRSSDSTTWTTGEGRPSRSAAVTSSQAAARPAIPPPTTATVGRRRAVTGAGPGPGPPGPRCRRGAPHRPGCGGTPGRR